MHVLWIVLAVAVWIGCGVLARGLVLGFFTRRFPDSNHILIARLWVIGGPVTLIVELFTSRWADFRLKPLTDEQRYLEFKRMYPPLDREYFERKVR